MKKKLIFFFILSSVLALLFLFSNITLVTDAEEEGKSENSKAEWSIFVYMAADNNLENAAILDMNELEQVGSTDKVKIVVQIDRSTGSNVEDGYDSSNGDWTDTRRYFITKDNDSENISSLRVDDGLGELDMSKPNVLVDFLVWAVENYPAKHYLVVIWDHGLGTNGGVLNDMGTYMTLPQMEDAFNQLKNLGLHFDIITFDACLMGGIENYYNVAEIANISISSEKLVPYYGYPYHHILDKLVENPYMNASSLAERFVKEYVWYYKTSNSISLTQSAVDTSKLLKFTKEFNKWTELLMAYFPRYEKEVREARNNTEEYDLSERLYNYVDLYDFIYEVNLSINTREFNILSQAVLDSFEDSIVAESHWTNFNKHGGKDLAEDARGATIYFPNKSKDAYYNSYRNIKFARETKWKDFLDMFFNFKDEDYRAHHKPSVRFKTTSLSIGVNEKNYNNSFLFSYSLKLENMNNTKRVQLRYELYNSSGALILNHTTPFFNHTDASNYTIHYEVDEKSYDHYSLYIYLYDEEGFFLDYWDGDVPLEFVSVLLQAEKSEGWVKPGESLSYLLTITNTGNSRKTFLFETKALPYHWSMKFEKDEIILGPNESALIFLNLTIPETSKESKVPVTFLVSAKCKTNESVYSLIYLTVHVGSKDEEENGGEINLSHFVIFAALPIGAICLAGVLFLKRRKKEDIVPPPLSQLEETPSSSSELAQKQESWSSSFNSSSFNTAAEHLENEPSTEPSLFNLGGEHIEKDVPLNLGGESLEPLQTEKEKKKENGFSLHK